MILNWYSGIRYTVSHGVSTTRDLYNARALKQVEVASLGYNGMIIIHSC